MNTEQLWATCLGELEVLLSKANFTTWFKDTSIISAEGERVVVGTPNSFTKEWLEKKYHPKIVEVVAKRIPGVTVVEYLVCSKASREAGISPRQSESGAEDFSSAPYLSADTKEETGKGDGINPRYTFDNFVIGESNRLAHAAAMAISKNPGTTYNPLFIYGGVGLGKTHLVHAIGNEIAKKDKKKKIVYTTCERFTNEFISLIRKGKGEKFKDSYRNADILMVDDIQFLSGKESTQEEFFHTFNALHGKDKQIVITSDRPPKAIAALEDRLISRLEWGMIADINPPDLETRVAILKNKASEKKYVIAEEIIHHIAKQIQNNVRELEGALHRVVAYAELNGVEPKLEEVKQLLGGAMISDRARAISPRDLLKKVSEFYDVTIEQLLGTRRNKELVYPRQVCAYLLREELALSFPRIGKELGGKDHTTIIHACNKIGKEMKASDVVKHEINGLRDRLRGA